MSTSNHQSFKQITYQLETVVRVHSQLCTNQLQSIINKEASIDLDETENGKILATSHQYSIYIFV